MAKTAAMKNVLSPISVTNMQNNEFSVDGKKLFGESQEKSIGGNVSTRDELVTMTFSLSDNSGAIPERSLPINSLYIEKGGKSKKVMQKNYIELLT